MRRLVYVNVVRCCRSCPWPAGFPNRAVLVAGELVQHGLADRLPLGSQEAASLLLLASRRSRGRLLPAFRFALTVSFSAPCSLLKAPCFRAGRRHFVPVTSQPRSYAFGSSTELFRSIAIERIRRTRASRKNENRPEARSKERSAKWQVWSRERVATADSVGSFEAVAAWPVSAPPLAAFANVSQSLGGWIGLLASRIFNRTKTSRIGHQDFRSLAPARGGHSSGTLSRPGRPGKRRAPQGSSVAVARSWTGTSNPDALSNCRTSGRRDAPAGRLSLVVIGARAQPDQNFPPKITPLGSSVLSSRKARGGGGVPGA